MDQKKPIIPWNQFLGSLNVYKFGLWPRTELQLKLSILRNTVPYFFKNLTIGRYLTIQNCVTHECDSIHSTVHWTVYSVQRLSWRGNIPRHILLCDLAGRAPTVQNMHAEVRPQSSPLTFSLYPRPWRGLLVPK